jgi:3-hydroxy-9,10-secoandrosta-1,3,5(10)-triene-9,17-dione monooxygenase reductase component
VLVSLQQSSYTLACIDQSGCFAVNVLAAHQQPLAERFASRDRRAKIFSDIPHPRGARVCDIALFDEALARVECRLAGRYPGGDHVLLLGQVMALECSRQAEVRAPLLFYCSAFQSLQAMTMTPATEVRTQDG